MRAAASRSSCGRSAKAVSAPALSTVGWPSRKQAASSTSSRSRASRSLNAVDGRVSRRTLLGTAAAGGAAAALPESAAARARKKTPKKRKKTADVVVVGGGLAGLTAARELTKAGVKT